MTRAKTGKPPGRVSDFSGEKQAWLESFHDLLVEAGNEPGQLYTDVENANSQDNPPPSLENPSTEEKKEREAIRAKLRIKIANWFRNRYKAKKVHGATIKSILSTMQGMLEPGARPRLKPAIEVYSKLYYASRIKPEFDKQWAAVKDTLPATARVSMSQDFVQTSWQSESAEFKKELEMHTKMEHEEALKVWKGRRVVPEASGEVYHQALESLSEVGIPLADALAEKLGMHVIICAVGPVGSEKGEVCLRTIFSDTSNAATPRTWAQFDPKGFTAMEASITRYGCASYTKAQCRERAWPPVDTVQLNGLLPMEDIAPGVTAAPGSTTSSVVLPTGPAPGPAAPAAPVPMTTVAIPTGQVTLPTLPATTVAPATSPHVTSDPSDPVPPEIPEDGLDRTEWADSLVKTHAYLSKKKWGDPWATLLSSLVAFEWSFYHQEEFSKLPKGKCRPEEFAQWMKEHRPVMDYPLEADFGDRMLDWWKELGPKKRWDNVGEGKGQLKEPPQDTKGTWCGEL
ncbi:hypothetical protein DFH07DRAFT_957243 [Mycena maculata]|uniref:Uncharacterized protein n=1 Tax=Mycena maculata TaxID=230809 RepID=A0AAD7JBU9_9AGAR|nr:hypothetical protein DFH07DRAFT_957243 [Mycena maculata]